ncbi:MAG: septum formation initiator family protein [bacterium]|nr:septum formation initiator family protein [bacterium]
MPENFLYSKYSLFALLVIFLLLIIALGRESYFNYQTNQEIKKLQEKIENLEKDNVELAETEKYFQSEEFLEKEARLKLNLIRDGEKLIIVKEEDNNSVEEVGKSRESENISNFRKWWRYFFGK